MRSSYLNRISSTNGLWIAGVILLLLSAFGNMFNPLVFSKSPVVEIAELMSGTEVFGNKLSMIFQNTYLNYLIRFLILLGCALLLQFITSEFRLIRVRSYYPFFLFCVFSAAIIPALPLDGAAVACFFFCWSCYRLFAALDMGSIYRGSFDAAALLAVASLFQSRILFLLPVYWMVMGILQILSFKSFSASLLGAVCILWVVGGVSFLIEDYSFLLAFSKDLISFELINLPDFSPAEIAYTSFLGLLMISAMFSFWPKQHLDKLRTRNYLNSILLLWFALLALWVFSGNNMGFLLLLFCLSALMAAHFFSLIDNRFSRSIFVLLMILSVSVYFLF